MDALHTSVPASDLNLLPGSTSAPLGMDLACQHPEVRVLSVMIHDTVTPEVLAAFPNLEAIVTRSDGYDHVPLDWCHAHQIAVHHLEGYATDAVAELALTHLLALRRRVPEAMSSTRDSWLREHLIGHPLRGATIGVLGTGRIGARVVDLLQAVGANVIAHDIAPDPDLDVRYVGFDELWGADGVSIHVPLTDATYGLVSATQLDAMPDGGVLVNTSRGAVIDEDALLARLDRIRFGADVLRGEPDPPNRARFAAHPNVILSPHVGAYDTQAIKARYTMTAAITDALLAGQEAPYRV